MYMNHVPTYEHLKRRVERLQKKDAVATVTEKERQQVLNVLNPRSYETPDELLHVLSGILREFQPWAKITRIHESNGKYYTDDRHDFPVSPLDHMSIMYHGNDHIIYWENEILYFYSEAGIYAIDGVPRNSYRQIVRVLLPISKTINDTLMTVETLNQDSLTGLLNIYAASRVMQRLDQEKSNCAIIMLDMRDLTGMNAIGQHVWDSALQHFGRWLQKVFQRKTDLVTRIWGDEFMVIMQFEKDTPLKKQKQATKAALERVKKYFETGEDGKGWFRMADSAFRSITFASGVGHSTDGKTTKDRLEKADEWVRLTKSPGSAVSKLLKLLSGWAPIPARQLGRLLWATENAFNRLAEQDLKEALQGYSDVQFP